MESGVQPSVWMLHIQSRLFGGLVKFRKSVGGNSPIIFPAAGSPANCTAVSDSFVMVMVCLTGPRPAPARHSDRSFNPALAQPKVKVRR